MADYIKYWLGSIHTYSSESAPVILVASHSEDIDDDPDKKVRQYVEFFLVNYTQCKHIEYHILVFYTLSYPSCTL